MLKQFPTSLPALTALATVIAAGIGAVVAIVVALVNAWSSRRIAVDTAHRAFRSELAGAAVAATQEALKLIHTLNQLKLAGDAERWRKLVASTHHRGLRLKLDLRTPHDPVFAAAIKLFVVRRANLEMWLAIKCRDMMPDFGLTVARAYINEAAEIVQIAAEGYIFNLRKPRKRAQKMLKEADPTPLKKRIDARLAMWESLGDEEEFVDLDQADV